MFISVLALSAQAGTEDRTAQLGGFDKISVSGAVDLNVVANGDLKVVVKANDKALANVKTEVVGGQLMVTMPKMTRNADVELDITMPELTGIRLSGACDAEVTAITTKALSADVSGAIELQMTGQVDSLEVAASGAAEVDTKGLQAKSVGLDLSGAVAAQVHATEGLRVSSSGATSVRYFGDPKEVSKDLSGAASMIKGE